MNRVLCIVDSMTTGGAETFLMKLYRKLDKTQYQMDFIASAEGHYDAEIRNMGGKVYYIPMRTQHLWKAMTGIRKIVATGEYHSVLKLGSTPIMALDLLAAKLGGAKKICVRSCNAFAREGWIYRIANVILRPMLYSLSDVKIAPSDLAARYTFGDKNYEAGRVNILHNGVDLGQFHYDPAGADAVRREFGIENDALLVGHVGRFSEQKNHDYLLQIFCRIVEKNSDAKLLLVGQGKLESQIRERIKDLGIDSSVIFAGVRTDIPQLLSAMDVFVFPSFHEGMPNTVIEAQATGLPCVIADTITREANITGLVQYLSLDTPPEQWAEQALAAVTCSRKDTISDFIDNQYDIQSVADQFVRLCFGG